MTARRGGGALRRTIQAALPWVLTIAIFAFLFSHIPVTRVVQSLGAARWGWYVALMLPYSIAYLLLDALAVTVAVQRFHAPVRYSKVLPVRAATYVLSLVNSNVGQGGLALWLNRREGLPLLELAGTFVFLAFVEIYQLVIYSSLGVLLAGTRVPDLGVAYAFLYVFLAAFLLYFNGLRAIGWSRPAPGLLATFGRARLSDYGVILAIKSVSLLLAIVVHHVALGLFGMSIPLLALLANLPLVFLVSALPITVAKLGTSQLAWSFLLGAYAPEAGLVAYSLAAHVTFLITNAMIGVAFLPRVGKEVWELGAPAAQEAPG
ncbi:MAG TPA: hypothetical protein VEI94_11205 [Candidatus Bathyarchaeia archaeon]|nr:hypothetical protein [Candidatus Bathyarchaeia archaeon]